MIWGEYSKSRTALRSCWSSSPSRRERCLLLFGNTSPVKLSTLGVGCLPCVLTQANWFIFTFLLHCVQHFIGSRYLAYLCERDSSPKCEKRPFEAKKIVSVSCSSATCSSRGQPLPVDSRTHRRPHPRRPSHPQNPPLLADGTGETTPQIEVTVWWRGGGRVGGKLFNLPELQCPYLQNRGGERGRVL